MKKQNLSCIPLLWVLTLLGYSISIESVLGQYVDIKQTKYDIPAGAYFTSPSGSTANTGKDSLSPWPLKYALANAPAGATIVLRGGEYRDLNLQPITKLFTLQAYPGEKPWIKGSALIPEQNWVPVVRSNRTPVDTVWRLDNWNYYFGKFLKGREVAAAARKLAGYTDMVFFNDQSLRQVGQLDTLAAGEFYVDSLGYNATTKTVFSSLYVGSNPAGNKVESARYKRPFAAGKLPDKLTIKGIGFTHFIEMGIAGWCNNMLIENCTFSWNGIHGAQLYNFINSTFRGNVVSYNGMAGISTGTAHGTVYEGNLISYNNIERFNIEWAAAGLKITSTTDIVLQDNIVENNYAAALWLDIGIRNAKVLRNTVRNNGGQLGIFFEISNRVVIAGNLCVNNGVGIMTANSANALIYNNTLFNNSTNLLIKEGKRVLRSDEIAGGATNYTLGNVIKNNIFSNARGTVMINIGNDSCETDMIEAMNYNAYYRTSATQPATLIRGTKTGQCQVLYSDLASFRADFPLFEEPDHSFDITGGENPFFINPALNGTGNYYLKAGSPAIGAGEALPEAVAQALGWPAGVAVDLGAFQTQAPQAPSTLQALTVSQQQINLSWLDQSDDETGFLLERSLRADSGFVALDTLDAGVTTYSDTALPGGTTYYYRLAALNTGGKSSYTPVAVATTFPAGTGLLGTYYNNKHFNGKYQLTRLDSLINFDWGTGAPAVDMDTNTFSVRWQGQVEAVQSATYTFYTHADDGVRLWVDGKLLIDAWHNQAPLAHQANIELMANQQYNIRLEYYENEGPAQMQLFWSSDNQPKQLIPARQLFPAVPTETEPAKHAWKENEVVKLYPNPVSDQLRVCFKAATQGTVRLSLLNGLLQPVLTQQQWVGAGEQTLSLPVRQLPAGIYLVSLTVGNKRVVQKVIISH